jgi:oligo-alginate lyase
MLRLPILTIVLIASVVSNAQEHPVTFITKAEAAEIKKKLTAFPVLTQSYNDIKSEVDQFVGKEVDVPFPKDPAGG